MLRVTSGNDDRVAEWHVRRQRADARTTLLWFIDLDLNRMSWAHFLDNLESNESFRTLFVNSLVNSDRKSFVWETRAITLKDDFECALTEVPVTKKARIDSSKFAAHFRPEVNVVEFPSPDGSSTLVVPCPKQAEGWSYGELDTFLRKGPPVQVQELWQALARAAKAMVGKQTIWLSSTLPGVPWVHLRVDTSSKHFAFKRYVR